MRSLDDPSEMVSLLVDQNTGRMALILQASHSPVSDPLLEHSHAIKQKNQWISAGRYCQCGLHRSFSSVCYWRSYFLALLAEAHGTVGEPETGVTILTEALALGERWYEAEIYRLKGALLLQQHTDNQAEAETCFQHAVTIARAQQAKSFELRTATSLAKLWQQQGKRQEAHDLLAPVYHWFTEGFDTLDLQEARALLEELGG
jgi:tetratricopeptide (TPR) repeat protein